MSFFLLACFGFQLIFTVTLQQDIGMNATTPSSNLSTLKVGTAPSNMDIRVMCADRPSGSILPVYNNICTRLYIHCSNENNATAIKRCDSPLFINPETAKCEDPKKISLCRTFLNITEDLDVVDGVTAYCRREANCGKFSECCLKQCARNGTEPTCSKDEFNRDEAFCRCSHKKYVSNKDISARCMESNNCSEFTMCCFMQYCPALYVQCESSAANEKPSSGSCYC